MESKEKWIEETMNSINSLQSAALSDTLQQKIIQQAKSSKGKIISMPTSFKWAVAASVALLLALNLFSMHHYSKTNHTSVSFAHTNPVYEEYLTPLTNF